MYTYACVVVCVHMMVVYTCVMVLSMHVCWHVCTWWHVICACVVVCACMIICGVPPCVHGEPLCVYIHMFLCVAVCMSVCMHTQVPDYVPASWETCGGNRVLLLPRDQTFSLFHVPAAQTCHPLYPCPRQYPSQLSHGTQEQTPLCHGHRQRHCPAESQGRWSPWQLPRSPPCAQWPL